MKLGHSLSYAHFEQMEQLELLYYGPEYITPAKEAYRWYQHYPYTVVAAEEAGQIVGFVNLFPVKEPIAQALKAGEFNDHDLTPEGVVDLAADQQAPLHMFLSCVLVEPEYRRQGLTRTLLRAAAEQYASVYHRCVEVITDNVTEEGERFSQRYGFRKLCHSLHGSVVYGQPWQHFVQILAQGAKGDGMGS